MSLTQPDAVDRLGITTPIFGFSHCRDVVAAVSKAGGLGVYGAGLHSDAQIAIDIEWIEAQLDGKPYGIDLLMPSKYVGSESGGLTAAQARAAIPADVTHFLDDMMLRYDVPEDEAAAPDSDDEFIASGSQRYTAKQQEGILEIAFAHSPRLLVSALGTPPRDVIERAHAKGMLVAALAGRVKHAVRHVEAGVDIVIAQSYEAGGHTGEIGGMVLTPLVVDAVAPVPVLAAGGIGDGRQMAAALVLGARGVWCGSVWLPTAESDLLPVVKQRLVDAHAEDTQRTRAMTGKPSRLLRTAWVDEWERSDTPDPLPNPIHAVAIGPYVARIEKAAAGPDATPDHGPGALAPTAAGQVVGLITAQTSCRRVLTDMMEGCIDAIAETQALLERGS
ncbi:NAD(P)H-dependent flavin oxidoreductase [Blastomonas fulva]|uniref:NAD(P)H-dependent flavin oxidoreductase n=1 Tax=Blastomonas fulva TaxID=1550728 RepID=UPI003F71BD02